MKKKRFTIILTLIITNLFGQIHDSNTNFVINKQRFQIILKSINKEKANLIIKKNKKIISFETIDAEGLADLHFPDFNNDGFKDIMLTYMGNNFTYFLYLFDVKTKTFRKIEGFERFPDSIQLKNNPRFYYSYHRAGCADLNWVSDLFYIHNFKSILVGHIYARGCEFEVNKNPQFIKVYKISNNLEENQKLIDELSYLKNVPKYGDKWEFLDKYWNSNYDKFNLKKLTK